MGLDDLPRRIRWPARRWTDCFVRSLSCLVIGVFGVLQPDSPGPAASRKPSTLGSFSRRLSARSSHVIRSSHLPFSWSVGVVHTHWFPVIFLKKKTTQSICRQTSQLS